MRLPLFSRVRRAFLVARSDSRSAAILQEPRGKGRASAALRRIGALVAALGGVVFGAAAAAEEFQLLVPAEREAVFLSVWENGEAPMRFSTSLAKSGPVAEGLPQIGAYDYYDGKLYGCYDPERRVIAGVWTQTDAVTTCARAAGGEQIWGRFEFTFTADGHSFDGWWTSCAEGERFRWDGALPPTAIQAPDMREPMRVIEALPRCTANIS